MIQCAMALAFLLIVFPFRILTFGEKVRALIPRELESIYLGMSVSELQTRRPGVQRLDLQSVVQYFETDLESVFFDNIHYLFDEDKLVKIILRKNVDTKDFIENYKHTFLKESLLEFGNNFESFVRIHRGSKQIKHYFPVLIWIKNNITNVVIYTPSCDLYNKKFNSSNDPLSIYTLFYFEMVIMESRLNVKKELSALDFLHKSEIDGSDCLFDDIKSLK